MYTATTTPVTSHLLYKADVDVAKATLSDWWQGRGLALYVTAPAETPHEVIPAPPPADALEQQWLDPLWRTWFYRHEMAHTFFGGVALPLFKANIGPGSLGLLLGAKALFAPTTVWYEPVISDPDTYPPLRFSTRENVWWDRHIALLEEGIRQNDGRYMMSCPDLVENLDTLAQLRDSERLLIDLIERPDWVRDRLEEIETAWQEAYAALWPYLRQEDGSSAFHAFRLWGPGKTAKLQCDICCMISPRMFKQFVLPSLARQCDYLDYALYHLDGTTALPQLENLLSLAKLQAIEWTPQAGIPQGGSPEWYDLYRRIKAAGKSVQAIEVQPDEVLPLIDAVGPEGLFIWTACQTEAAARTLLERVGWKPL